MIVQYIKRSAVKVAVVPQYDGLAIEDFISHAKKKPEVLKHLPEESHWNHIDKKWLCDVIYTLDPEGV